MEKLEKEAQIQKYFYFYQTKVLPEVEKLATQKKEGYHGLYTHTKSVVFRAIDYALELGENPMPALFAAACHDMARVHEFYDEQHGENAVPFAQKVMAKFPDKLTEQEQQSVLEAIKNHTTGTQANDYVSACLWDADRTRLAWERGYYEKFFNTAYAKTVASGSEAEYRAWQDKVLNGGDEREDGQRSSSQKPANDLAQIMDRMNKRIK